MSVVRVQPQAARTLVGAYEQSATDVRGAVSELSPLVSAALALLDRPGQHPLYGPMPALTTAANELSDDGRDLDWRLDLILTGDATPMGMSGILRVDIGSGIADDPGVGVIDALLASGLTETQALSAKRAIAGGADFTEAVEAETQREWADNMAAFRRIEAEAWAPHSPVDQAQHSLDQIRVVLDTARQDSDDGDGIGYGGEQDGIWSTNDLKAVIENEHGFYTRAQVDHATTVLVMAESSPEARELLGITESDGGWSFSDIGHLTLDVVGMVPVVGNAADAANATWYASEGDYLNAALSSLGMIPAIGQAVIASKPVIIAASAGIVFKSLDEALQWARRWLEARGILRGADEVADAGTSMRQSGAGGSFDQADAAYDAIRANAADIDTIARHTQFNPQEIADIKHHLFEQEHLLDRYVDFGVPAEVRRFDSHPGIAASWNRLETGTHTADDIRLLNHELTELRYMAETGNPSYTRAHEYAESINPAPDLEDMQ